MTRRVPPLWRYFVAALDGTGITNLDKLASDRLVAVTLNAPLMVSGSVPSDSRKVWTPYDDSYRDPYLAEGSRLLWAFRRESDTPPYYTVRGATICQLVEDDAEQDNSRTSFTGWDPWMLLMSRPVVSAAGEFPGTSGLSFSGTQVAVIAAQLLRNATANLGVVGGAGRHAFVDAGNGSRIGEGPQYANWGGTAFYTGTLETGAAMAVDIVFQAGTTVGQAWQQLADSGQCDIILDPIYDPFNRPNYLVELNVYAQAGVLRNDQIFAWNLPGRSLVGINRQQDGAPRANRIKPFAGQGGSAPGGRTIPVVEDSGSVAEYGQYWATPYFVAQNDAAGVVAATSFAEQRLVLSARGKQTVQIRPAPDRAPRPWQDYQLGDRVPVWASAQKFRQGLGGDQTGLAAASMAFGAGTPNATDSDLWVTNDWTSADPVVPPDVGTIGYALNSMAQDPTTRIMWAITSADSAADPGSLIRIDLDTGAGTLVDVFFGDTGDECQGITFLPDGTCVVAVRYGIAGVDSFLATCDLATAQLTYFGSDVFPDGTAQSGTDYMSVVYSPLQAYLFVFVTNLIYRVDPLTGMIDQPAVTTILGGALVLGYDLTYDADADRIFQTQDATGGNDDTYLQRYSSWYNPGGNVSSVYVAQIQPTSCLPSANDCPVTALAWLPSSGAYQRIYGWRANISDDALETVDLLMSPQGFSG